MARKLIMHSRRLTRSSGAKKALYRNLVTDLLGYEKITTTEAKAKAIRGVAEKMITLGKKGDLHARRQALSLSTARKLLIKFLMSLLNGTLSVKAVIHGWLNWAPDWVTAHRLFNWSWYNNDFDNGCS